MLFLQPFMNFLKPFDRHNSVKSQSISLPLLLMSIKVDFFVSFFWSLARLRIEEFIVSVRESNLYHSENNFYFQLSITRVYIHCYFCFLLGGQRLNQRSVCISQNNLSNAATFSMSWPTRTWSRINSCVAFYMPRSPSMRREDATVKFGNFQPQCCKRNRMPYSVSSSVRRMSSTMPMSWPRSSDRPDYAPSLSYVACSTRIT